LAIEEEWSLFIPRHIAQLIHMQAEKRKMRPGERANDLILCGLEHERFCKDKEPK